MSLNILVAGATGRFGAVAELLLEGGHRVRALTREPESAAASALEEHGARIVRGDYADPTSLAAAARGVDAVFASGTAHKGGPQGELRHGVNLVQALEAAGAPHLVYVSGAGADRDTGVPVLESKRRVEARLRAVGLRHTILAPVYLMENALNPWSLPALHRGKLALALAPRRRLQQVATADVVAFAVLALERAQELAGERIELAGDELTGPHAAAALSRAGGRDIEYEQLEPSELGSVSPGLVLCLNGSSGWARVRTPAGSTGPTPRLAGRASRSGRRRATGAGSVSAAWQRQPSTEGRRAKAARYMVTTMPSWAHSNAAWD